MPKHRLATTSGTVAWFNDAKGYGEIVTSDGDSFYFSFRELQQNKKHRSIKKDALAEFVPTNEIVFGLRKASNVREVQLSKTSSSRRRTNTESESAYEQAVLGLKKSGRIKEIR